MPKQTDAIAIPANVKVIEDMTQQHIIQKRRQLREQLLKQIDQQTSKAEQNIKELVRLTS